MGLKRCAEMVLYVLHVIIRPRLLAVLIQLLRYIALLELLSRLYGSTGLYKPLAKVMQEPRF